MAGWAADEREDCLCATLEIGGGSSDGAVGKMSSVDGGIDHASGSEESCASFVMTRGGLPRNCSLPTDRISRTTSYMSRNDLLHGGQEILGEDGKALTGYCLGQQSVLMVSSGPR